MFFVPPPPKKNKNKKKQKKNNNQIFNFCRKCSLSIKKHNNENRISFGPSVKRTRTWQILCIPIWTFLLFNAICLGISKSLLDFIFKWSYLGFECSDLDVLFFLFFVVVFFLFCFSVLHLHLCGQQFQTKIKISIFL